MACITAKKGKLRNGEHSYQAEYEVSRKALEKLISERHLPNPWKMPTKSWVSSTATRVNNALAAVLRLEPVVLANELYLALRSYGGLSDRDAKAEANKIARRSMSGD